ncbi:hypothetical protein ACOZB2_27385, partial [Pantoea endophytica]
GGSLRLVTASTAAADQRSTGFIGLGLNNVGSRLNAHQPCGRQHHRMIRQCIFSCLNQAL